MESISDRPQALLIPMALQGHWDPMKIFIRELVRLNISCTVLTTPGRISELQALEENGEYEGGGHVQPVEVFGDPGKEQQLASIFPVKKMESEFLRRPSVKEKLIAQKLSGHGPTFVVSDMFLYWTQDLADELGLPRYSFFTSPTTFALVHVHAPALIAEKWEPRSMDQAKRKEVVKYLGMEMFQIGDLPQSLFLTPDAYLSYSKFLSTAAGIIVNSFLPFEAEVVNALRTQLEIVVGDGKVPSIFLVGPLLLLSTDPAGQSKRQGVASEKTNSGCLSFLNTQSEASVLYICFGSRSELNQSSINELARGLELSEVSFLWVLPRPKDALPSWNVSEFLPSGFQLRTKGRGLVHTGWAPQKAILDHLSVGGFLTHCGWNSLVETIRGGVPIIPWPLGSEQFLNARFMVESAGVGVEIKKTNEGEYVGEEIAKAAHLLLNSDHGKDQRQKMQELKRAAIAAVGEGGSSQKALHAFLQEVSNLPK